MSTSDSQCQLTTVAMCLIAAVLLLARSRARAPCRRARWHRVSMPADLLPASLCCGWRLAAAACIRMPHVRACMLLLPRPCMPQPVAGSGLARCQDALRLDAACLRCCLAHMLACLHFVLDGHMHACRTCWHASEWPWLPEPGTKRSAAVLVLCDHHEEVLARARAAPLLRPAACKRGHQEQRCSASAGDHLLVVGALRLRLVPGLTSLADATRGSAFSAGTPARSRPQQGVAPAQGRPGAPSCCCSASSSAPGICCVATYTS